MIMRPLARTFRTTGSSAGALISRMASTPEPLALESQYRPVAFVL
jgi:hypothetical protein